MEFLKTTTFTLAANVYGDQNASRLALLLPGRLDTKDYAHMAAHGIFLASQGFLAVSFDPPGTWGSPGDIALYTVTNYVKAVHEVIAHFGSRPAVLVGHSVGGRVAMIAGPENEAVTHSVYIMSKAGPSGVDLDRVVNDAVVSLRDLPPGDGEPKKEFHLPLAFFKDAETFDVMEKLKEYNKPKLFIVGKKDKLIRNEEIQETFMGAGEPKELKEIDWGHDYRRSLEMIETINDLIKSFVEF